MTFLQRIIGISRWWISILSSIIILYLSFIEPASFDLGKVNALLHADKLAHFLLYTGFTLLLFSDLRKNNAISMKSIIFVATFPIVFGGLIELAQHYFFQPRTAEWLDWFSNIGGVVFALIVILFIQKRY